MDKRCDLHIHSNFSDSDATLEGIFKQAHKKNLSCIAITDHDTVGGIKQARAYSKIYNIELIEAIELSAQHKGVEIHVLGYFIDADNKKLEEELAHVKELRIQRLLWMAQKLNSLGIGVDIGELVSDVGDAVPTRLHLALYMLKKKRVKTLREAFKKHLSPGKPAYKAFIKYSVMEAIALIKNYGGLAVLAHPHIIGDQSWVEEFISMGIDGLETAYHNMSLAKRSLYENMVLKSGLLRSGGSDAHGTYKDYIQVAGVTIPYSWVQDMKKCLKIPIS